MIDLPLKGLKLIRPRIFRDDRGFFKESYRGARYLEAGIESIFVQDNHSFSQKDVIRGMHFQSFPGQDKLVWVSQGKIFDVAIDLRQDSPTFGKWHGLFLDSDSQEQFFVPKGFAHGFCVVSEEGAHVHYKVSALYDEATEKTFRYDDPTIQIQWPIHAPILSLRDQHAPYLQEVLK